MKLKKIGSVILILASLTLVGCGASKTTSKEDASAIVATESTQADSQSEVSYPITIKHAFGETVITKKPQRVVTISWGNQDLPLALGVVPVGVSEANYGVEEGENLLPWTKQGFSDLGEENPNVFKDTAGLDYEAISDAKPDVILASYSGITQEEYDLLSQIAPVVAYKTAAWQTLWRDQIIEDATGMGMEPQGEELVSNLEKLIDSKVASYPQIKGKKAAYFYFSPSDLGKFYVYLPGDPRAAYLTDLGFEFPQSIKDLAKDSGSFSVELSAENADVLNDVDVIVAYGNADTLKALQADALLGSVPAIKNGAVALIEDGTPLAASATPSALSIPATIDQYLQILGDASSKVVAK